MLFFSRVDLRPLIRWTASGSYFIRSPEHTEQTTN